MNLRTFERAVESYCWRTPFVPFYIQLVSGDSLLVQHPEALAQRNGLAVFVKPDGVGYRVFDSECVSQIYDESPDPPFELDGGWPYLSPEESS
jgi:hypothetical protein